MQRLFTSVMLLLATSYAGASSTSNFSVEGTITGSTCKMSNPVIAVELPLRSRTSLAKAGDTAGKTPFSVTAEKCPAGTSIYFQYDPKSVTPQGRLFNTVEAGVDRAENVELELLNSDHSPINLFAKKGLQGNSLSTAGVIPDSATFKFFVQYYATGAATAGKVKSSLTFIVESF